MGRSTRSDPGLYQQARAKFAHSINLLVPLDFFEVNSQFGNAPWKQPSARTEDVFHSGRAAGLEQQPHQRVGVGFGEALGGRMDAREIGALRHLAEHQAPSAT